MATLDRAAALREAEDLAALLCEVPAYLDMGTEDHPTPELALMQIVFQVNRQNYLSLLASLRTDHVVVAAQLARSLLEESIRWEWMTDRPGERMTFLLAGLYDNLRKIENECNKIGADPGPFLSPSPLWRIGATEYRAKSAVAPGIEAMLHDIKKGWQAATADRPDLQDAIRFGALYAQYRVLCQFTHTNLLGMIATVQVVDGELSVGQQLSDPVWALVLQSASASAYNVAKYTVSAFSDHVEALWPHRAMPPVLALAKRLGEVHGLHM